MVPLVVLLPAVPLVLLPALWLVLLLALRLVLLPALWLLLLLALRGASQAVEAVAPRSPVALLPEAVAAAP